MKLISSKSSLSPRKSARFFFAVSVLSAIASECSLCYCADHIGIISERHGEGFKMLIFVLDSAYDVAAVSRLDVGEIFRICVLLKIPYVYFGKRRRLGNFPDGFGYT